MAMTGSLRCTSEVSAERAMAMSTDSGLRGSHREHDRAVEVHGEALAMASGAAQEDLDPHCQLLATLRADVLTTMMTAHDPGTSRGCRRATLRYRDSEPIDGPQLDVLGDHGSHGQGGKWRGCSGVLHRSSPLAASPTTSGRAVRLVAAADVRTFRSYEVLPADQRDLR